jgi:hypothetical protein
VREDRAGLGVERAVAILTGVVETNGLNAYVSLTASSLLCNPYMKPAIFDLCTRHKLLCRNKHRSTESVPYVEHV